MRQRPRRHPASRISSWHLRDQPSRATQPATRAGPRICPTSQSLKSLNGRLCEPPEASGWPHRNPTSPGPGRPPRVPHGHDDTPRYTPVLLLELRRKHPLSRLNAGDAGCQPGWQMVVRGRVELPTFRFSGVLSRSAAPSPRQIIDPVHPYCCWQLDLRDYFSRCAATCRKVPFCPCYSGVDHAAHPDLCYSRVGFTRLAEHPDDADVDGTRRDRGVAIRSLLQIFNSRCPLVFHLVPGPARFRRGSLR